MAAKLPTLESRRLVLRPYAAADQVEYVALQCDAELRRYMGGPLTEEAARTRFQHVLAEPLNLSDQCWAVTHKSNGVYIGHAYLVSQSKDGIPEVGIMLQHGHQHQGFASEAVRAIVEYSFAMVEGDCVKATVDVEHFACHRMLERVGMSRVREERDENGPYLVFAINAPGLKES